MVKKLMKGSVYLFAFALAAVLSLFMGNKGGYVLSTADLGGVPIAHADVADLTYYDAYAGAAGAGAGGCGAGAGAGGGVGSCGE